MKGINGVQCQVHPKFLKLLHELKDDWHIKHKNREKDLSIKRLSLTLSKLFEQKPDLYFLIVNSDINLDEE